MKATLRRAWHSTTLTSWASQSTRTASLLLVLPLVLRRFSQAEVAVWYLFMGMISMSALADFGFRATFIRLFAFAAGGAEDLDVKHGRQQADAQSPNWGLIERISSTMRQIYSVLSVVVLVVFATAGSLAMHRPISQLPYAHAGWIAWGVICFTAAAEFQGRLYQNYLDGMNHVAMAARVETLTRLGAIFSSFAVMVFAPSLLNLVIANRAWAFLNLLRDRTMARRVNEGRWSRFRHQPFERAFFDKVWRPAWRSGISGLLSVGVTNLTGIVYAQFASTGALAAYLFAVKLVSEIRNLTYAPLYSKVPQLSRLRAQGDLATVQKVARRGINTSYAVYFLMTVAVGLGASRALAMIGSRTTFVNQSLWWLLVIGYFGHRIGAMHLQVQQTTNQIVSHILDTVAGVLLAVAMIGLVPWLGVYGFPLAIIIAYLGYYVWMALIHSYRTLGLPPREFVIDFVVPPAILLCAYTVLLVVTR